MLALLYPMLTFLDPIGICLSLYHMDLNKLRIKLIWFSHCLLPMAFISFHPKDLPLSFPDPISLLFPDSVLLLLSTVSPLSKFSRFKALKAFLTYWCFPCFIIFKFLKFSLESECCNVSFPFHSHGQPWTLSTPNLT